MNGELMKKIIMTLVIAASSQALAIDQKELTLNKKCLDKIAAAVNAKYGAGDETFSIFATKLLYGGSKGGLHINPVVLVQTSDEVEPRDIVVITSVDGSIDVKKHGCKVVSMNVMADGMTVDIDDAVPFNQ